MTINIFPTFPNNLESAQICADLFLDGGFDIPSQTKDVLASLLVHIVNSRPGYSRWSWEELDNAIIAAIDCGESDGLPVNLYIDAWSELLHSPGFEGAAKAVDSTPMPKSTAGSVRSAIRTVALPSIRALCGLMEA
jgi:hypothetical protein